MGILWGVGPAEILFHMCVAWQAQGLLARACVRIGDDCSLPSDTFCDQRVKDCRMDVRISYVSVYVIIYALIITNCLIVVF